MSAMLYTHTAEPLKIELEESNIIQSFTGSFIGHLLSTNMIGAAEKNVGVCQGAYSQLILNGVY